MDVCNFLAIPALVPSTFPPRPRDTCWVNAPEHTHQEGGHSASEVGLPGSVMGSGLDPGDQCESCCVALSRLLWASVSPLARCGLGEGPVRRSCHLSLRGLRFGRHGGRKPVPGPARRGLGAVGPAAARSAESREVAPEEDVDGQQEDGIGVADAFPERRLLDAAQLLLQRGLLCRAQGSLRGPREPTEPAPEQLSPGPAWGWGCKSQKGEAGEERRQGRKGE